MKILAVDPGNFQSAWVMLLPGDAAPIQDFGLADNHTVLRELEKHRHPNVQLVVEMVQSYGMPVGREIFDTVVWIGRFIEAWGGDYARIGRKAVVTDLCGSSRAKDPNVRQALLDLYGPQGTKRQPGQTYGISKDVWAALAVATVFSRNPKLAIDAGDSSVR